MQQSQTNDYRSYQGGYFRTLISPEQTKNTLALLEFTLPAGAEPPLHIHKNEDESFYVLEGRISVRMGEEVSILEPGDALFAPRNTPHTFKILSGTAKALNLITPGSLWNYFMEFSTPLTELPGVVTAGAAPGREEVLRMLKAISTGYNIQFLETK